MKRRISIGFLIAVIALTIAVPVLASYYANLTVVESNSNDYTELGMQVALDVDYLASNGYISATGLDTRVTSSGTDLPHMMVDDTVLFVSDVEADGTLNLLFETGETALSSFPIVVGDGGYVTITDHANLELANDFKIEFDGYIDTSSSLDLVKKTDAFNIYTGGGNVYAEILDTSATVNLVPDGVGDYTNISGVSGAAAHWQAVDDTPGAPDDATTYVFVVVFENTADAYTLSYDAVLDNSRINSVTVYYRFRVSDNAATAWATPGLRLSGSETLGDESSEANKVWTNFDQTLSRPGGGTWSYTDMASLQVIAELRIGAAFNSQLTQIYVQVDYTPRIILTAAGVATGEHKVEVYADGSDYTLEVDDVVEDTETLGGLSVDDNGNDIVIENMPYYDYYTHTISSTLRITYEPDSIIVGTTLPNEENPGTYDGTITLGSNPAGVTVTLGGLVSDEQLLPAGAGAEFPDPQDIAGPTGDVGLTAGLPTLTTHPLYPLMSAVNSVTDIPIGILWIGSATLILAFLFVWMIMAEGMMHQMFVALAGGGWVAFCYHQGVYPFWVIFIYAALAAAIVIGERSPTIS